MSPINQNHNYRENNEKATWKDPSLFVDFIVDPLQLSSVASQTRC